MSDGGSRLESCGEDGVPIRLEVDLLRDGLPTKAKQKEDCHGDSEADATGPETSQDSSCDGAEKVLRIIRIRVFEVNQKQREGNRHGENKQAQRRQKRDSSPLEPACFGPRILAPANLHLDVSIAAPMGQKSAKQRCVSRASITTTDGGQLRVRLCLDRLHGLCLGPLLEEGLNATEHRRSVLRFEDRLPQA